MDFDQWSIEKLRKLPSGRRELRRKPLLVCLGCLSINRVLAHMRLIDGHVLTGRMPIPRASGGVGLVQGRLSY